MAEGTVAGQEVDARPGFRSFRPGIPGIGGLLAGKEEFFYGAEDGLNMVLHGPAGAGKTLFALQMAIGALAGGHRVIYLTKDTNPETLLHRIWTDFQFFGHTPDGVPGTCPVSEFPPVPLTDKAGKPIKISRTESKRIAEACLVRGEPLLFPGAEKDPTGIPYFVLLDRMAQVINSGCVGSETATMGFLANVFAQTGETADAKIMAMGRLGLDQTGEFVRYAQHGSLLEALSHLCPSLRPIFSWMGRDGEAEDSPWCGEKLFVVCDSLPPQVLEECLRMRPEGRTPASRSTPGKGPVTVFVMESVEMPDAMVTSFPPDVQIRFSVRDEIFGKRVRTVQVLKARFQEIYDEPHPFIIMDRKAAEGPLENRILNLANLPQFDVRSTKSCGEDPRQFIERRPGITVLASMPSLLSPTTDAEDLEREEAEISFGNRSINKKLTKEGWLSGGKCTLLITENRCHSTPLALHYLLGQIGASTDDGDAKLAGTVVPHSVLYIALEDDLVGILHRIWRHRALRPTVFGGKDFDRSWEEIQAYLREQQANKLAGENYFFKVPLRHMPQKMHSGCKQPYLSPYLYILVPELAWEGPEEILQRLRALLDVCGQHTPEPENCKKCLRVDRVVLNRVSQIPSRWPLVRDTEVFVSGFAKLCASRSIDLMIVDDTAEQSETTGHLSSHWQNLAANIIRLRRIPVHGSESVGLEVIRCNGTAPGADRALELREVIQRTETNATTNLEMPDLELQVFDTFRGFTGVFTGKPQRCKTIVDLTYDRPDTPLHLEIMNLKRNLQNLMEGVRVNPLGPRERPGINSALGNLAHVSRDTCHVVSVDEVWLHQLLSNTRSETGLVSLSEGDLAEILPNHIKANQDRKKQGLLERTETEYVTQALTIATRKAGKKDALMYAIPFRHNWGILVVNRFRADVLAALRKTLHKSILESSVPELLPHVNIQQYIEKPPSPEELQLLHAKAQLILAVLDLSIPLEKALARKFEPLGTIQDLLDPPMLAVSRRFRSFLQGGPEFTAFSWRDIMEFKTQVWNPVFYSDIMRQFWSKITAPGSHSYEGAPGQVVDLRQCFDENTHFEFFDLNMGTVESRVCFFLELLLAHVAVDTVFKVEKGKTPLYRMAENTSEELLTGFKQATCLLYGLLRQYQRKEFARIPKPGEEQEYPGKRYSLLSREWMTTVRPISELNDIREKQERRHLPTGGRTTKNLLYEYMASHWTYGSDHDPATPSQLGTLEEACFGKGVPISGTWYLGIMSGGNRELGNDIIRELVSEYHEMDRFLTRAAPPVSKRFYTEPSLCSEPPGQNQPYFGIIRDLAQTKDQVTLANADSPKATKVSSAFLNAEIVFPFCRARIRGYTKISLFLAEYLAEAMQITPGATTLAEDDDLLTELANRTLKRIQWVNNELDKQPKGEEE